MAMYDPFIKEKANSHVQKDWEYPAALFGQVMADFPSNTSALLMQQATCRAEYWLPESELS